MRTLLTRQKGKCGKQKPVRPPAPAPHHHCGRHMIFPSLTKSFELENLSFLVLGPVAIETYNWELNKVISMLVLVSITSAPDANQIVLNKQI